jgi:transcriptional regulator of acetoin/glycerol metabolism
LVEGELGLLPAGKNTLSVIPSALRRPAAASRTGSSASGRPAEGKAVPLSEIVRRACQDALARHGGNVTSAARALGIAKGTLYRQIGRPDLTPLGISAGEPPSKPRRNKPRRG